ncbi:MAG: hypothetical protein HUU27_01490 [Phycisphaerae bacterium]|nr:hypothetical protein [Phycisphaerae bacterium]
MLADDFVFDHPLERMTKSEFIQRLSHSGTWSSITEIAFVHGTDGDAATVEATDDVTGLRHRLAWVVTYKGDKVQRITATSSKIM